MSELDGMVRKHPLPTWRWAAWIVITLIVCAVGWAHFTQLEEVAIADGEVVPRGQIKVIQHLEGGIVEAIDVADGDKVTVGQSLVRLNLAPNQINREELQVRLDGLVLARARLDAEVSGTEPEFPAEESARRPNLLRRERDQFESGRREQQSALAVLKERIRQRQLDVRELGTHRQAVTVDLGYSRERFQMSRVLLEKGLTSRMEHVQLTREVEALGKKLEALDASIPRSRAALAEAREREREIDRKFKRQASDEIREVEGEIARIGELMIKATEQADRTLITSPIDGIVKNLRYHTIGGVVRPGEPIMEIVPTHEKLVIVARLNPIDRGYVEEGQRVVVKVTSYDFVRYGGLEGVVAHIAADANSDANGRPYFRVIAETEKAYLGEEEGSLPIVPGMQASIDIHTGSKTVIEYLLRPVLKLRHESFRER